MTRSASYELGRARGIVTGRAEPTERDEEWLSARLTEGMDAREWDAALEDLAEGMLDGRDQATSRRLGLPCPEPPSAEMLAAAREPSAPLHSDLTPCALPYWPDGES